MTIKKQCTFIGTPGASNHPQPRRIEEDASPRCAVLGRVLLCLLMFAPALHAQSIARDDALDLVVATNSIAEFFRDDCGNSTAQNVAGEPQIDPDLAFSNYSTNIIREKKSGTIHAALAPFLGVYSTTLDFRWSTQNGRQKYSFLPRLELTDSVLAFDDSSGIGVTVAPKQIRSVRPVITQRIYLYRTLALPSACQPEWNLSSSVPATLKIFGMEIDTIRTTADRFVHCLRKFASSQLVYAGPLRVEASDSQLILEFYCILLDPVTSRHHLLTIREMFNPGSVSWRQINLSCDLHPYIRSDNVKSLTGSFAETDRPKIYLPLPKK